MNSPYNASDIRRMANRPPLAVFFATTIVIFFLALSAADSVGFVPNYIDGTAPTSETQVAEDTSSASVNTDESLALTRLPVLGEETINANTSTVKPIRIKIDEIGLDLTVQNPDTRDIEKLDALLQNGPARYVESAKLGNSGNTIIFAHSSHLPIVHNKMYKAFNRIPELGAGDSITLVGDDGKEYLYTVESVRKADATDATIDMSVTQGTKLTLVTCDTLTSKTSRYILTADFVGTIGE